MWVAWSFPCLPQASPKPSAAGFSEIETITWPCLRGACMNYCMTSLLPQFPYCFFQLLGRCPCRSWAQGPNWCSGVQSFTTLSSSGRGLVLSESSPWREENSQTRSLFPQWGVCFSWWQLWQVCVCSSECYWFPWFSPTAQDPPASFSSSEVVAKTTLQPSLRAFG